MSKGTVVLLVILSLVAALLGWNYWAKPFKNGLGTGLSFSWFSQQPSPSPMPQPSPQPVTGAGSAAATIATLLVAPVTVNDDDASSSAAMTAWVTEHQPAMITLFGEQVTPEQVRAQVQQWAGVVQPPAVAVDHEGGTVQRLAGPGFTKLPSWQSWCTASPTQAASNSAALAASVQELNQVGVDVVLAPVLDLAANHPVLKSRICSDKTEKVASAAAQLASAYTGAGITPVFKHFPGIGETKRDLHRQFDRVTVDIRDAALYRALLVKFPQAGVMTAHTGVINQFPDIPCSLSSSCVGQITTTFPSVLIMTDAIEMEAAGYLPEPASGSAVTAAQLPLTERVYKALLAGNDLVLFGPSVTAAELDEIVAVLAERYSNEPIFAAAVNNAYTGVIHWKRNR